MLTINLDAKDFANNINNLVRQARKNVNNELKILSLLSDDGDIKGGVHADLLDEQVYNNIRNLFFDNDKIEALEASDYDEFTNDYYCNTQFSIKVYLNKYSGLLNDNGRAFIEALKSRK